MKHLKIYEISNEHESDIKLEVTNLNIIVWDFFQKLEMEYGQDTIKTPFIKELNNIITEIKNL